ncbi:MAG: hypothetical protein GEU73_13835 [Chloroflexi bacterium]|nr:hypothetical protein [Chloroflexota bacterium]
MHESTLLTRRRFLTAILGTAATAACGIPDAIMRRPVLSDRVQGVASGGELVVGVEQEPRTLVPTIGGVDGGASEHLLDMVHQAFVTYDDRAQPIPRLVRELPSLERGTWRVHEDGTMETVWRLRDNVFWHDGEPLTPDDIVFSCRVFSDPSTPVASRRVARLIDAVESPDPSIVVMHWRSRYAFADQLTSFDLTILPSHLLQATFELRREGMSAHPYWRDEFVGLGPYRVSRWTPGSSIQLTAFDRYFLGRPHIDSVSVRFLPDDNTAMAAILSGEIDMLLPRRAVLGIVRSMREQWGNESDGNMWILPGYSWAVLAPQFLGPQPEELQDVRVRQALAYAIDRGAVAEVVTGDPSLGSDLWLPAIDPRYAAVAGDAPRYPYDPDRARDLFREAGWRREAVDDVLVKQGQRFQLELAATAEWERPVAVVAEYWRNVGVDVKENIFSFTNALDRQGRAAYSGVELTGAVPSLAALDSRLQGANVPAPENQWLGTNRGHYSSRELEGLLDRFWITLDQTERQAVERQIAAYLQTELPIIGLFFYPAMAMARVGVQNCQPPTALPPAGRPSMTWNVHDCEKQ